MKRVKLIVAYDGTNYCGWQQQPNAITVEGILNEALTSLLKEEIRVIGASRTDSGVHAKGNVAVFDTCSPIPAEKISYALNQRLPEDIVIQKSEETSLEFHPRRCNCVKTYEYKILNSDFPSPTHRLYSYFVYKKLDLEKMKLAATFLVGEHDFKSFCSIHAQVESTVRTIYSIEWKQDKDLIHIIICGNGFLYNMVRIITGTLVQVGMGFYQPEHVREILELKDRKAAGPTAPAKGLQLNEIRYEV
ncbi:tRNA pseudouridine(38-40) synthase TruA [Anaeromicropila populeti]|uniref:tRNA pseudouridine synthase A n=1 Tax=Anaeromicropila populeti TaxID=37658 RepID=A0A1I6IC90_9FIRM|nr:tRNA pseudouridine(38-40) synthase TruA [Anaeromicropila populeti]SFR64321.1 tRNA pseudouridine38-40 synthase [Anaeromicropila populeti]